MTRISCLQAANADPNHRENVPILPSVPQTSNSYSSDLHHFVNIQNHHLTRLRYLFPEINPAALKRILGNHTHMQIRD